MSTQLRLVEPPAPAPAAAKRRRGASRSPKKTTASPVGRGNRRAVNWGDWRLDARTRSVGRAGVARARRALEAAAAEELSRAS